MLATADITHDLSSRPLARIRYLHNWDRLRIVGSLDILGSHLTGVHTFGGIGLPAFLIVSIALTVRSAGRRDPRSFVWRRARRALAPWLFWSLIIAAERSVRAAISGKAIFGWVRPNMALYGPEIQLWFLPFIAVVGVLAGLLQLGTQRVAPRLLAWLAVTLSLLGVALSPWLGHGWPFEQWAFSLPAVGLGFALGRLLNVQSSRLAALQITAAFSLGVILLCCGLPIHPVVALRYVGAATVVTVCTMLPNRADALTPRLVELTLGIYALHMLVYRDLVAPLLTQAGAISSAVTRVLVTFLLTGAIVALLRRGPLRSVL